MTTRADMATRLALDPSAPTKTFVVEAHAEDPHELLADIVGSKNIEPTEDAFLCIARLPEGVLWVDLLDNRFWSIHTDVQTHVARTFLHKKVEHRRELDWMWLPSDHLRNLWPDAISRRVHTTFNGRGLVDNDSTARDLRIQLSGRHATDLLEQISALDAYRSSVSFERVQASLADSDLGQVEEGVSRMGSFVVTGNSFEFHVQFVRGIVQRYKRLITLCESKAIAFTSYSSDGEGSGGTLTGGPILIEFNRRINDLDAFLNTLLSSRAPYRLWGVPQIHRSHAEVHAVDLHVANTIRLDVAYDWMRIYLNEGSCGNTVARLVANLQHTFDSALRFADPELQSALKADEGTIMAEALN